MTANESNERPVRGVRRIPAQSVFYERLIPIALGGLAVLLVVILAVALGFLLGVVRF